MATQLQGSETPFPAVPLALLTELERLWPSRPPQLKDSEREVWFKAGARSVVDFLKAQFQRQQDTVLAPPPR
jgi:hypothetical protein